MNLEKSPLTFDDAMLKKLKRMTSLTVTWGLPMTIPKIERMLKGKT
jgi:hypothetical protein